MSYLVLFVNNGQSRELVEALDVLNITNTNPITAQCAK